MKLINAVSIWDNGQVLEAKILNSYAVNVTLGTSATFYYQLFSENVDLSVGQQVAQGNLSMTGEAYAQWEVDAYAWDWVASELNLTIIGDYVPPVPPAPEPETETTTEETTETEPTPEPETEG
jgi:hypothetical protein